MRRRDINQAATETEASGPGAPVVLRGEGMNQPPVSNSTSSSDGTVGTNTTSVAAEQTSGRRNREANKRSD